MEEQNPTESSSAKTKMSPISLKNGKKKKNENKESDAINDKLNNIILTLNKVVPTVSLIEANMPGILEMKKVFEEEKSNFDPEAEAISSDVDESEKELKGNSTSIFKKLSFGEENSCEIGEDIAFSLTKVLKEGMDKTELKSIQEKYVVPKNCPRLNIVPTNANIENLNTKAKHTDRQLIKIQKILTCGLSILSQGLTLASQDEKIPIELLSEATAVLGHGSYLIDKQRRLTYESCLNVDYARPITGEDYPIESKLFGDDFNEKIKCVSESLKAQQKVRSKKFFFNRFSPYNKGKPFLGNRKYHGFKKNYQTYYKNNQYRNNQVYQNKRTPFFKRKN